MSTMLAVTPAVVAAWWWTREPSALAPAPRCAGLVEVIGAGALRTWPDTLMAGPLGALHVSATMAAVALLAAAVMRLTGSWRAAAGAGLACAAAPMWRPVLGITDGLALLIAAAAVWSLARWATGTSGVGGLRSTLLAGAAVAPPLTFVALGLQGAIGQGRGETGIRRGLWAIAAVAVPIVASWESGGLPEGASAGVTPCLFAWAPTLAAAPLAALAATAGVGVLVAALVALGIVDGLIERRAGVEGLVIGLVLPVAAILIGADPSARVAAPAIVCAWALAGLGLATVERHAGRGRVPAAASAGVIIALVALLVATRWPGAPALPARPMPEGHDLVTTSDIKSIVTRLPKGAVLIREDALTDLHLRAISGRIGRSGADLRAVDASAVATVDPARRVFAWPRAQRALLREGYQASDAGGFAVDGLAELRAGGHCESLTREWRSTDALAQAPAVSLQADTPDARGPVVLWLSGPAPIDATRIDWPSAAWRGFHRIVYDLAGDAADANFARRDDGLTPLHAVSGAITRLEMWRTPDAPLSLSVALSSPPSRVDARVATLGTTPVRVCPSFAWTVRPMGQMRPAPSTAAEK